MMVFDVDGTLVGGEAADWASFGAAFEEAAGFVLDEKFFARLEEVTAQAIIHQALQQASFEERKQVERAVRQGYLRRLQSAHESNPSSFPALDGALALLAELKRRGMPVAIATGDWFESSTFKLRAAGVPFDAVPMVTSSDFYSRADIIAGAIAKAGRPMHEAVYIGDGLWDLRAARKLGIPFVGVGSRKEKLEAAGAAYTLPDLSPVGFWRVMGDIRKR
jgi:phosphoglycolate phosphatase-like HAD superfamily hydrolase